MRSSRRSGLTIALTVLAGAIVAASCKYDLGGPLDPRDDYWPAVFVTGRTVERPGAGWSNPRPGVTVLTSRWEADDPRLSGDVSYTYGSTHYGGRAADLRYASVSSGVFVVENADGRWSGPASGMEAQVPNLERFAIQLAGEGAYAGLSAYILLEGDPNSGPGSFQGLLFPGPMPTYPLP